MSVARPAVVRRFAPATRAGRWARRVHDGWLRLSVPLTYELRNRPAREAFRATPPPLSEAGRRIVEQLNRLGFAHAHYTELVPPEAWARLQSQIEAWLTSPEHLREVEQARSDHGGRSKSYQVNRSPARAARLDFQDPLLRFGVRRELLDIVNSYMGLMSRLIGADAWHTIPVPESSDRRASQRWHRDPEDSRLVKMFAYFTDVDEGTGATEYVPRSRPGEQYGDFCPRRTPNSTYPPPGILEEGIPASDRVTCCFPAGTILFVDTVGFHRGGWATRGDRVLANWIYTSQATWFDRWFQVVNAPDPGNVSVEERFALLTPPDRRGSTRR